MGAKKKTGEDGDDLSCEKFFAKYKKNVHALGEPVNPKLKDDYEKAIEDTGFLTKIHMHDPIGWQGTKAVMDALRSVEYEHCKSIRFWQCGCEDEGVRAIVNYIAVNPLNVNMLDLMFNEITPLGC